MTLENDLANEVLLAISSEKDVYEVDQKFKKYYEHIFRGTYDVKLFNKVDHQHTKYLIQELE